VTRLLEVNVKIPKWTGTVRDINVSVNVKVKGNNHNELLDMKGIIHYEYLFKTNSLSRTLLSSYGTFMTVLWSKPIKSLARQVHIKLK
jgi:hypothetical protein